MGTHEWRNPKSKYYQIQNKSLSHRQAGKIPNPKLFKFWILTFWNYLLVFVLFEIGIY